MHESSFFDASLVVLIGFLVFIGVVLKFGYRKAVQSIDDQIKDVSITLEEAQTLLTIAQDRKSVEQQLEKQLAQEIATLRIMADKQIEDLKRTTNADIEAILHRKQLTTDSTFDLMRQSTIQHLQDLITHEAVDLIQQKLKESSSTENQRINEQAIQELKALLASTGANSNGGAKNQAIA
ncbi:MAG: hypothetical protein KF798_01750 [Candidatus Paracaedibacteraceae bacterium]|nr:hypothetical protein [Candidatus Paracaedibacteraceae bacterium]